MRRTQEEAAKTKQDLLDAALAIFSQKGYQAARLQDIAETAGTTRGAIYHHFQNKAGIYTALLESASNKGIVAIQEAIGEGGTFDEICQRILVNSFNLLAEDTYFRQVTALSLYKTGISAELAHLETDRIQQMAGTINSLATFMQQGIDSGDLRDDMTSENLARAFLAFQNGIMMLWLYNPDPFSIIDEAPAFADILTHGIGKR